MPQILVNTTKAPQGLPDAARTHVLPGANTISDELAKLIRSVPHTASLLRRGILKLAKVPAETVKAFDPKAEIENLATLTPDAAEAAIAACEDRSQLEAWTMQDGRARVRAALQARAEALEAGLPPETEDKE